MPIQADAADQSVELSLESVQLRTGDHVGVFYRGDNERDALVIPVVTTALAADCGVVYVCDNSEPEQVERQLRSADLDVDAAKERGQIRLVHSTQAYLPTGCFDPGQTVGFYRDAYLDSAAQGFSTLCVIGEMSWSLRGCPGTERLLEYEALYAQEFGSTPAITLCLYDLERTRGEHIFDLLRLHGRVVLNGIEMHNPHVDPGFFLGGADALRR
jgi:hypothetical protein